jgi:hypothetical protein
MEVKQTSELIKSPNSTIQRLVNAIVGFFKNCADKIFHLDSHEITADGDGRR